MWPLKLAHAGVEVGSTGALIMVSELSAQFAQDRSSAAAK
jgi:hypothetical protein